MAEWTLEDALTEWVSKKRRMGCVSAAEWLCKRVPRFKPLRLYRDDYEHVVATDGKTIVDLTPALFSPG